MNLKNYILESGEDEEENQPEKELSAKQEEAKKHINTIQSKRDKSYFQNFIDGKIRFEDLFTSYETKEARDLLNKLKSVYNKSFEKNKQEKISDEESEEKKLNKEQTTKNFTDSAKEKRIEIAKKEKTWLGNIETEEDSGFLNYLSHGLGKTSNVKVYFVSDKYKGKHFPVKIEGKKAVIDTEENLPKDQYDDGKLTEFDLPEGFSKNKMRAMASALGVLG